MQASLRSSGWPDVTSAQTWALGPGTKRMTRGQHNHLYPHGLISSTRFQWWPTRYASRSALSL